MLNKENGDKLLEHRARETHHIPILGTESFDATTASGHGCFPRELVDGNARALLRIVECKTTREHTAECIVLHSAVLSRAIVKTKYLSKKHVTKYISKINFYFTDEKYSSHVTLQYYNGYFITLD